MTSQNEWKLLTDFQHNRLRTEVMLGSRDPNTQNVILYRDNVPTLVEETWCPAVFCAFREIFDNALDEVVGHGFGNQVDVTYDPATTTFSVEDNGRGMPIDVSEEHGLHAATILISNLRAGRNFDDDTRGEARGQNGVGASAVNNVSKYMQLDVHRSKKHFSQRFSEGDGTALQIDKPVIRGIKVKKTGTRVEFQLSSDVFKHLLLPEDFVRSRILEAAVCYPKINFTFNGEKIVSKGTVESTFFAGRRPVIFDIAAQGFSSKFWLVPQFFPGGQEFSHGLVNAIPLFEGGVHIDAFKNRFAAGLLEAMAPQSKKRRLLPNKSDVNDGTYVFNLTQMDAPSFSGQSKMRLINDSAKKHVLKAMDDPDFFKRVMRGYPEWIESIYEKCAERTQKTSGPSAADKKRLKKRVEDLSDACAVNRSKCVLFLAEGNSAVSGIVEARDPDIHGALPLRGKILNVLDVSIKDVMKDESLCKIMNAIGLVPGERANRAALRYAQVYLTCDADPDGANIFALLINFFYKFWPELFDPTKPAFVSVFDTPLIIASKGKTRKYWYAETYMDFDPEAHKGYSIVRAKGLAALTYEDWGIILQKPKTIGIVDDGDLTETMSLLFDKKRADDRKEWMGI